VTNQVKARKPDCDRELRKLRRLGWCPLWQRGEQEIPGKKGSGSLRCQIGKLQCKPIPSGGVVRNIVATPDRRLYLACSGVNTVAVVSLNQ
jgi:hypothetical protein